MNPATLKKLTSKVMSALVKGRWARATKEEREKQVALMNSARARKKAEKKESEEIRRWSKDIVLNTKNIDETIRAIKKLKV